MRGEIYVLTRKLGYNIGRVLFGIGHMLEGARRHKKEIASPRSILITGASSGIGAELSRQYAAPGVFLYLTGRDQKRLTDVALECMSKGARVETRPMDVCDDVAMDKWIKDLPRIDLAIANAGVSGGTAEGENNDAVREIFSVNIGGVLNTVLPMVEKARNQNTVERSRGHIAIMASMAGLHALPTAPAYSASKACVTAYADALRGSLRKEKIQVTVIGPGYIKTPMTADNKCPMPMLMSVEDAAYNIRYGLWKRHSRVYFPRRMYWLLRLANLLPLWLSDPIFRNLPNKI